MRKHDKPVLLVEDAQTLAALYGEFLRQADYDVVTVATGSDALAFLGREMPSAVMLDLMLPDMHGLEVLARAQQIYPHVPVIVATATNSADMAVEAMRRGAYDYIVKPVSASRLVLTLDHALDHKALRHEVEEWRLLCGKSRFHNFVGQCDAMQAVYRTIDAVAHSGASVFILGENGTGKELVAQALHAASPRAAKPFLALNCAAIPHHLLESLLFGHKKGSFTGAASDQPGAARATHGGTLLLDEICELPLEMQGKLLRFLQTGEIMPVGSQTVDYVDVRVLCATNRNPLEEVKARRFREDLYYRLAIVPISVPALRERDDDIVMLADHFLARYGAEEQKTFTGFTPEVLGLFRRYEWPGNVRQLENVVRHITLLHQGPVVTVAMLPDDLKPFADTRHGGAANQNNGQLHYAPQDGEDHIRPLWLSEKAAILHALNVTGHDISRAAGLLQISASTIYRKLLAWDARDNVAVR